MEGLLTSLSLRKASGRYDPPGDALSSISVLDHHEIESVSFTVMISQGECYVFQIHH